MSKFLWQETPKHFRISRSEIHIWQWCLNATLQGSENGLALLSEEETNRLKLFKFKKDRFCYFVTHCMKRCVIARYLNALPETLSFTRSERGKPTILAQQNWLNLQFNISHSHQIVLIALTLEDPIGIDIEYHAENTCVENLSKFVFSSLEKQFFSTLTHQEEKKKAFFRCWTRKEAYLKAEGIGLTDFLTHISVDMNELPSENWLKINKQTHAAWRLFSLDIDKTYTASVVSADYPKYLMGFVANDMKNLIGMT